MRESEWQEWRNYWVTRRGARGYLGALWQVGRAGAAWVRRKLAPRAILPDYLSTEEIARACQDTAWITEPLAAVPLTPGELPQDLLGWARAYHEQYERFLVGTYQSTEDLEDYWTLHQFGWLFVLVVAGDSGTPPDRARWYIERWVERLGDTTSDAAWRSFSISERLCNWVHIFRFTGSLPVPQVVENVRGQAFHLARHLETFPNGSANNHLINNGRALYLVGRLFNHDGLTRLARAVLLNEAERQVTTDGFLDEGSSHYQVVFTRAYLDVLQVADTTNDTETKRALELRVGAMLRACSFFADNEAEERWWIPFIGDISPDPPPCMFGPTMRFWQLADEVSGWPDFSVPWFARRTDDAAGAARHEQGWRCYPRSGYYRWRGGDYCVWWHARRRGAPRRHSHNDWGSFQLHVAGEPLFIDTGRKSYRAGGEESDGRLTLAHNCVTVDGFEQAVILKREFFVPDYLRDGAEVEWSDDDREGTISMRIFAYERLAEAVRHTRTFHLRPDEVTIEDVLDGGGIHRVTVAFHLAPDVRCAREPDGAFVLRTPRGRTAVLRLGHGAEVAAKRGGLPTTPGGYCSTQYGTRQETTSIFAEYGGRVPMRFEHRVVVER